MRGQIPQPLPQLCAYVPLRADICLPEPEPEPEPGLEIEKLPYLNQRSRHLNCLARLVKRQISHRLINHHLPPIAGQPQL